MIFSNKGIVDNASFMNDNVSDDDWVKQVKTRYNQPPKKEVISSKHPKGIDLKAKIEEFDEFEDEIVDMDEETCEELKFDIFKHSVVCLSEYMKSRRIDCKKGNSSDMTKLDSLDNKCRMKADETFYFLSSCEEYASAIKYSGDVCKQERKKVKKLNCSGTVNDFNKVRNLASPRFRRSVHINDIERLET